MGLNFVDRIKERLTLVEPEVESLSASVAVLINEKKELLMIRRSGQKGDPWSNQMAFPGGKRENNDSSFMVTAIRETKEELGINIRKSEFLGYMEPMYTHTKKMIVIPSVFYSTRNLKPVPSKEVSSFYWISIDGITRRKTRYAHFTGSNLIINDAFIVNDCIIWGLSYRIINKFLELLGPYF